MSSVDQKLVGAQFDALDKGLAARGRDLLVRPTIARQTYDEWSTDLNQLADFANSYGYVGYVAKQWRDELPRYEAVDAIIQSKIRVADPANYMPRVSISGTGCCDECNGDTKIPQLPYTPTGNYGSRGTGSYYFGGDSLFGGPSLGDGLRANALPFQPLPDKSRALVDKSNLVTSLLVAAIVAGVIWGIHYATKKTIT